MTTEIKTGTFKLETSSGNGYITTEEICNVKVLTINNNDIIYVTKTEIKMSMDNGDGTRTERISRTPQASTFTEYTINEVLDVYKENVDIATITWINSLT